MPKKSESNAATSSRKPPDRVELAPVNRPSRSQPRSVGKSESTCCPETTSCHRSSGELIPPGNRHAMPTIAIGSPASAGATAVVPPASAASPNSLPDRNSTRRSGVGWS